MHFYNKYLTQFLAGDKPLLPYNFDISLLVPAHIWENSPDTKMINEFHLSHYVELNSASAQPRFSGAAK